MFEADNLQVRGLERELSMLYHNVCFEFILVATDREGKCQMYNTRDLSRAFHFHQHAHISIYIRQWISQSTHRRVNGALW